MLPAIKETSRVEQITKFHDNLQRFIDRFGDVPQIQDVRKIQSHIDRGHLVFELPKAFEAAGFKARLPKIAMSPVGKNCELRVTRHGTYMGNIFGWSRRSPFMRHPILSICTLGFPLERDWQEYSYTAYQPPIPQDVETHKDSYMIWPAVWENKVITDPDPLIVEQIVGDYWAVTAAWDYTIEELEMIEQLRSL